MTKTVMLSERKGFCISDALVQRLQRHLFQFILLWEAPMRFFCYAIPSFSNHEKCSAAIDYFVVYVMLQAVAILWGFLVTVGAVLGSNMASILTMPIHQAFCVLAVYMSVIGLVLSFGRATWILAWQSMQNFPFIRHMLICECRPQSAIMAAALPMLVLLLGILLVPSICAHDVYLADVSKAYVERACEDSYLKFLTDKHPVFQRSLRLSTSIAMCQFIQFCLEVLPNWRYTLRHLSFSATLCLSVYLLMLNAASVTWFFEWVSRHFESVEITPLSKLSNPRWELVGTSLWLLLLIWILITTTLTYKSIKTCQTSPRQLVNLFRRLKYTFVFGQGVIFCRACIHPQMGFVHAQVELTIINLILPSIYVVALISLRMVTLVSFRSVAASFPPALGLASLIYYGSGKSKKAHSFVITCISLIYFFLSWSEEFISPQRYNRIQSLLSKMLRTSCSGIEKKPGIGHRVAKAVVFVGLIAFLMLLTTLIIFSLLSVLQKSSEWYPDAASVLYTNNSITVEHTAVVKMQLILADSKSPPLHQEDPRYASCANLWYGLSLVDFALLSEAAYFNPNSDEIATFVSKLFDKDAEVRLPARNSKTGSKLDFFEVYLPSSNASVISVKGTDIRRFTDFVEDVKMFYEPVVFMILSTVFPTIRIWPDVTFSTLIELYHEMISLIGLEHDFWYYHELVEYANSIQDRPVILTGHSMGGGIVRIVGSILGKLSVTFSPPGFVQSYSKLVHTFGGRKRKVERTKLHQYSVAVVPEYDPITMIDAQVGLVQKISCATPHLSMQLSCHMLEGTICNLLEHCGDPRKRIAACIFEHTFTTLTKELIFKIAAFVSPASLSLFAMSIAIVLSVVLKRHRASSSQSLTRNECIRDSETRIADTYSGKEQAKNASHVRRRRCTTNSANLTGSSAQK